jgi:hypothetical protein
MSMTAPTKTKICTVCEKQYQPTSNVQRYCPECSQARKKDIKQKQNAARSKDNGAKAAEGPAPPSACVRADEIIRVSSCDECQISRIVVRMLRDGILKVTA